MTTEQLKDWLKEQTKERRILVGSLDGNEEKALGVYLRKGDGQRICLGGPEQTRYQVLHAAVLVHWSKSAVQAEAKAREIWGLFYGLTDADMGGARVICADPGEGPVPLGPDQRGIYEYMIEVTIHYERE